MPFTRSETEEYKRREARTVNAYQLFKLGLGPYITAELQDLARQLHRADENACNYELSSRQEARRKNLFKRAKELAPELYLEHQADPRGWPIIISDEPIRNDGTTSETGKRQSIRPH